MFPCCTCHLDRRKHMPKTAHNLSENRMQENIDNKFWSWILKNMPESPTTINSITHSFGIKYGLRILLCKQPHREDEGNKTDKSSNAVRYSDSRYVGILWWRMIWGHLAWLCAWRQVGLRTAHPKETISLRVSDWVMSQHSLIDVRKSCVFPQDILHCFLWWAISGHW